MKTRVFQNSGQMIEGLVELVCVDSGDGTSLEFETRSEDGDWTPRDHHAPMEIVQRDDGESVFAASVLFQESSASGIRYRRVGGDDWTEVGQEDLEDEPAEDAGDGGEDPGF